MLFLWSASKLARVPTILWPRWLSLSYLGSLVLSYFEAIVCDPPSAQLHVSALPQLLSFSSLQVLVP